MFWGLGLAAFAFRWRTVTEYGLNVYLLLAHHFYFNDHSVPFVRSHCFLFVSMIIEPYINIFINAHWLSQLFLKGTLKLRWFVTLDKISRRETSPALQRPRERPRSPELLLGNSTCPTM